MNKWKTLVAEALAGDRGAQFAVGCGYLDGVRTRTGRLVVRRNSKQAFRWFAAAAHGGDPGAMVNVGWCYDVGLGVARSSKLALSWYKRAWRLDKRGGAANNIATVYRDRRKPRLAVAWYARAAQAGDNDALIELAGHYLAGSGVRRDPRHAYALLRRAAASQWITPAGRDQANYLLGQACLEGKGVRRSIAQARHYFALANRDGDHVAAARSLADLAMPSLGSQEAQRRRAPPT